MHTPASIDKFKAAFLDKISYLVLKLLSLAIEPHWEEFHLNVGESSLGVTE